MSDLHEYLRARAQGDLLPWSAEVDVARQCGLSLGRTEELALEAGLFPARYERNRKTLSAEDQLVLLRSKVAVVGCGGLGGYVIEELARLGVGSLTVIDPDVFEEHNLNRQILSSWEVLGCPKVEVAARRVASINPAVVLAPLWSAFSKVEASGQIGGVHVVLDALDDIRTRLDLAEACEDLSLPLVHGTIAGWYGQVTTQMPGSKTLLNMYGGCREPKGVEQELGNPSFTPAVVASLQAAEVCKVLLGKGKPLARRVLTVNLLDMTFEEIALTD
jgi:molybdopterin/thiamine biosynthesis adenylyltransferase